MAHKAKQPKAKNWDTFIRLLCVGLFGTVQEIERVKMNLSQNSVGKKCPTAWLLLQVLLCQEN